MSTTAETRGLRAQLRYLLRAGDLFPRIRRRGRWQQLVGELASEVARLEGREPLELYAEVSFDPAQADIEDDEE